MERRLAEMENKEFTLKSGGMEASFQAVGGQLLSLKKDGKEVLWQGDPAYWKGRAPILFPMVGGLRDNKARIGGQEVSMPRHGFARNMEMPGEVLSDREIRFVLEDNEETRGCYPYSFRLTLTYRLIPEEGALCNEIRVENTGDKPMPFAVGGHPAFFIPMSGDAAGSFEDYDLVFPQPEDVPCVTIDAKTGLLDFEHRAPVFSGQDRVPLKHEMFALDALIFDQLHSQSVSVLHRETGHGIRVDFPGFDYLGVWSAANQAPFVALEPWTGCGTALDESDEFSEKRGMTLLAPGESSEKAFTIVIL